MLPIVPDACNFLTFTGSLLLTENWMCIQTSEESWHFHGGLDSSHKILSRLYLETRGKPGDLNETEPISGKFNISSMNDHATGRG